MRIVLVTDAWHPQVNGVVRTWTTMQQILTEWGHELIVVNPQGSRTVPAPSEPDLRLCLQPGRQLRRILGDIVPDALHIATEGPLGLAARRMALSRGWRFTTLYGVGAPSIVGGCWGRDVVNHQPVAAGLPEREHPTPPHSVDKESSGLGPPIDRKVTPEARPPQRTKRIAGRAIMQIPGCFIGVDVGKFELQVAGHEGAIVSGSLANSRSSIVGWLKRLPAGSVIAMEATGGYQELLARLAHERGFAVYVLNPTHVHHYAISLGNRGKTDRLDAEVIAQYIAQRHATLHRYEPISPELQQVRALQALRSTVVRVGTSLRLSAQRHGCSSEHQKKALASLSAWAEQLERELITQIKAQSEWAKTYGLLTGICGIGPINGAALTTLFNRVHFASSDAAVAFCGLDPRPNESGRKVGRRRLSKQGDKAARTLLYNAASSAARTAHFKDYYAMLRARGLASTAALVVIARKLLRIAYGVWRTGQAFDPGRLNLKTA